MTVLAAWRWSRGGRRGILPGMPPAVPVPSGDGAARPDFWFPLALFGVIVALPVPLNAADWPDLRSAPSALIASGGDPLRTLVETGPQTQPWELALLPALVLLVAAAVCFARLPRLRGQLRAG